MTGDKTVGVTTRTRVVTGFWPGPPGRPALRYAAGLARWRPCPLFVVIVVPAPVTGGFPLLGADLARIEAQRGPEVRAELELVAPEVLDGLDVRLAVVRGAGPVAVLDRLADRPADHLVLPAGGGRPSARGRRRRAATLEV